ncbi:MAG TPA: hypothetical protein VFM84_09305 [Holophagaceae bacterium]|nr:hypothetical protein [Holophagaceae bacterium]
MPRFSGRYETAIPARDLLRRAQARAEQGLLSGRGLIRDHYRAAADESGRVMISAADLLTAINVGLNCIQLSADGDHAVDYEVRYRRWAAFCVGMCALLGLLLVTSWFFLDIGGRLDRHDPLMGPQFTSPEIAKRIFWGMVVFWGLVWPWILVAWHKVFARRALFRVLADLDAPSSAGRDGA